MAFHRLSYNVINIQETNFFVKEFTYCKFICRIKYCRHGTACFCRLNCHRKTQERIHIRFFKGNLTQFGKVKSVSIQISSVRIIQCILNWKPHIRCSKLCNDPSIFKFHHGMYHTLWLYNNLDLIQAHIKQPSGLHHFKAFIHQCRRIHGNLLSHHPVRVFQSIFQRH